MMAKKMKKAKVVIETIMEVTGLSIEQISCLFSTTDLGSDRIGAKLYSLYRTKATLMSFTTINTSRTNPIIPLIVVLDFRC